MAVSIQPGDDTNALLALMNSKNWKPGKEPLIGSVTERIDADATDIANVTATFLQSLESAFQNHDSQAFLDLFWEEGWFRDKLAFTWDIRSLHGHGLLREAFDFTSKRSQATNFKLSFPAIVADPYPDVSFIQIHFTFDTKIANCAGIAHLIQIMGKFKIWTLFTQVEEIISNPVLPRPKGISKQYATWAEQRAAELASVAKNPDVLVIGAGHSGLMTGAHLKSLGVPCLLVEQHKRVGDNWRTRYDNLSLHDTVHADHLPFMPFPSTWPTYAPAGKLADWLENYATTLDLNVWTSSKVTKATYDQENKKWTVQIQRNGTTENLEARQIVVASGLGASKPWRPAKIPGEASFPGTIHHASDYKTGEPWTGKRTLVVGTGSSGWDIAADLYKWGAKVTMLQRGPTYVMSTEKGVPSLLAPLYCENGPPLDLADRISQAMPYLASQFLVVRKVQEIADGDRELLEGLNAKGFRTWLGRNGGGALELAVQRGGGLYFDSGGGPLVRDGKIKIQPGTIKEIDGETLTFSDGKQAAFDYVVFATGFDTVKAGLRPIFGDTVSQLDDLWGADVEGEMKGLWRPLGHPALHAMLGNFQLSRVNSRLLSRGIVAQLNGLAEEPFPRHFSNNEER